MKLERLNWPTTKRSWRRARQAPVASSCAFTKRASVAAQIRLARRLQMARRPSKGYVGQRASQFAIRSFFALMFAIDNLIVGLVRKSASEKASKQAGSFERKRTTVKRAWKCGETAPIILQSASATPLKAPSLAPGELAGGDERNANNYRLARSNYRSWRF